MSEGRPDEWLRARPTELYQAHGRLSRRAGRQPADSGSDTM